jgi:hypothetical protein
VPSRSPAQAAAAICACFGTISHIDFADHIGWVDEPTATLLWGEGNAPDHGSMNTVGSTLAAALRHRRGVPCGPTRRD